MNPAASLLRVFVGASPSALAWLTRGGLVHYPKVNLVKILRHVKTTLRHGWMLAVLAGVSLQAGVIEGRISVTAPAAKAVLVTARYDSKVQPPSEAAKPRTVVYVEGAFPESARTNAPGLTVLSQKNLEFRPAVLPILKGTKVEFPNEDDEYHNVLSYSKAREFDLGRYRKDEKPPPILFDKAGAVELDCEIHHHMRATILVLETPFFTLADADGSFRLQNIPAGSHTLKAWAGGKVVWTRPVEVAEGGSLKVDGP